MTKIINLRAGAVDISSKDYYCAVPNPNDNQDALVRKFGCYTQDLRKIVAFFKEHQVTSIAMESTGIYWIELFYLLDENDFEVYLVNASHVKNVPGRKTDVNDAQWIQKLHSFGLLKASFQPDNLLRQLRSLNRLMKQTVQEISRTTNRMIKSLEQMNLKLNHVLKDITGKTGMAIIEAILAGERSAKKLAELRDYRIKSSPEEIELALEGNWKTSQLYALKVQKDRFDFFQDQLKEIEGEIEKTLEQMNPAQEHDGVQIKKPRRYKNQPSFNVEQYLYNCLRVDVTAIPGISVVTGLTIFSETGMNIKEKFPTEKQFLSWLNVVPNNKISGGKVLSSKVPKKKNRAGMAFRAAAAGLWSSKNPIADYLRMKKRKSHTSKQAIVATARKIASIYYNMVTKNEEYNPDKLVTNQKINYSKQLVFLERKMHKVMELIQKQEAMA